MVLFLLLCLLSISVPALAETTAQAKPPVFLQGQVGQNTLFTDGKLNPVFGLTLQSSGSALLPATITKIAPGGPAALSGLVVGDQLVSQTPSEDSIDVGFIRRGRLRHTHLAAEVESANNMLKTNAATNSGSLSADDLRLQAPLKILAEHDIVVIIDKSGSMGTKDCPNDETRWEWCEQQTRDFTETAAQCFNNGITLVVFSSDFKVLEHTTFDQIAHIFEINHPGGGTNTAAPLENQINAFFQRMASSPLITKPLIIAVVTDGEPNNPQCVRDVIIEATKQMTDPNEIAITFLQVGKGDVGGALLKEFDEKLVSKGALFDIVDTKTFDELQKIGLMGGLVAAVIDTHKQANTTKTLPAKTADYRPITVTGTKGCACATPMSMEELHNFSQKRSTSKSSELKQKEQE